MGLIKKIVFGDPSFTESQEKKRKLFMYLVSGGLTTLTNFVCYALFNISYNFHYISDNQNRIFIS